MTWWNVCESGRGGAGGGSTTGKRFRRCINARLNSVVLPPMCSTALFRRVGCGFADATSGVGSSHRTDRRCNGETGCQRDGRPGTIR
jgi:hypothetical protein